MYIVRYQNAFYKFPKRDKLFNFFGFEFLSFLDLYFVIFN